MITVEVMEGNGKVWVDDQWLEAPGIEDCIREYNHGCMITIYEDDTELDCLEI